MTPVTADEIGALPFPAGCPYIGRATFDFLTSENVPMLLDCALPKLCLAAVWWFRMRAEACDEQGNRLWREQRRAEDHKIVAFASFCQEEKYYRECADAWESILRRVMPCS
jgi:hypothetical protein